MKTTNTQTAANTADYQPKWVERKEINRVNETQETYLNIVSEILNNPKMSFTEFADEQQKATDISRIIWIRQWAMLNEQLSMLWLHKKWNTEKAEESNNKWITWAPVWMTIPLKGYSKAA